MGRDARAGGGRTTIGLLVIALVVAVGLPTARAEAATPAVCHFDVRNHATPGFSIARWGVDHASGPISCLGSLEGRSLLQQPGTMGFVFHFKSGGFVPGSGCLVFSGHGDLTVTLPTTTGPLTLTGDMHSSGTGLGAELHGRLGSAAYRGVAAFGPDPDHLDETCFTKPLEHFVSIGTLVFATS